MSSRRSCSILPKPSGLPKSFASSVRFLSSTLTCVSGSAAFDRRASSCSRGFNDLTYRCKLSESVGTGKRGSDFWLSARVSVEGRSRIPRWTLSHNLRTRYRNRAHQRFLAGHADVYKERTCGPVFCQAGELAYIEASVGSGKVAS